MTKNKFAGLTEAKLKSLEDPGQQEENREEAPPRKEKKKAVKLASKSSSKIANKQSIKLDRRKGGESDNIVGVTIKIPEEKRIWWNVQAKLQRTTVTDAIIEALDKRFGEPKF